MTGFKTASISTRVFARHIEINKSQSPIFSRVEGEIAIKMFQWAVADKITMINIHDAYAASPSHEIVTFEAMHQFRNEVVRELGLSPHYF